MPTIEWIMDKFKCSKEIAEQALQGFKNFLSWFSQSKLSIIETETEMVSEEDKFGGCLDLILFDGHKRHLGDIKTANGTYPDNLIQLAAYKKLYNETHDELNQIDGGFHLLRFSKENADFHHHYFSELDDAWEQFKLFRAAYEIDKKLKKRV